VPVIGSKFHDSPPTRVICNTEIAICQEVREFGSTRFVCQTHVQVVVAGIGCDQPVVQEVERRETELQIAIRDGESSYTRMRRCSGKKVHEDMATRTAHLG